MKFKFLLLITITLILLGSRAQTNTTTNTTATNTTTTTNTTTNTTGTNTTTNTSTTTNTTTNTSTGTNTSTNTTGGASTTGTVTIDTSVPNNCSNPLFTAAAFTYYGLDRPKYLSTAATATGLKACKAFEGKSSCCDATTTTDILASYNKWKTATLANLTSYAHSLKIAFNAFLQVNTMVPSANNASLTVAIKARINNLQFFMIDVNKNMASCAQASFQNVAEFLCLGCHPSWGKWVKGNSLLLSPNTCTKLSTNCQPLITNLGRLKNIARIADRDIIDLIAKYAGVQYDSVDSAISTSTIADTSTLTRRRRILQTTTTNTTVNTTTNTTGTNTTTNTSTTTNTTTNTTGTNTTTNTSTNTTGGASTTGFSDACTKLTSVVGEGKLVSCVVCASASSDAKCANNQFLNTPVSSWPSDRQVVPIVAYYKNDAKSDRYRTWMFYDTAAETKLHTEFTNLVATKPAAAVTALYIRVDAVQPTLVKQAALLSKQQDAAAAAKSGTAGSTGTTAQLRSAASLRSIQSVSLFESMYGTVIAKLNYDVRTSGGVFTCTAASTCQLCYDVAKTSCNTTQKPTWTAAVTIVLNCSNSICTECLSNSTGFTCFSYSMPNPDGTTITSLNNDTVGANYAYQASIPALRLYSNGTGLRIPGEIALPTNVFNLTYFKYTAPCTDDASCKTWLCNNMFKGPVINANKLTNPQDSNADLWGNAGVATATGRRFLEQRQLADAVSANTQDSNGVDYSSGAMAGSDMDQNATVDGVTPTTDSATAQSQIGYNYTGNFAGGSTNINGGGNNTVTGDSSNGKILTAFGAMFAVIFVALI